MRLKHRTQKNLLKNNPGIQLLLKANHWQQNAQRQNTGLPEPQRLQAKFLECEADIALYGGAAGSGKSYGMLLDFAKPDFLANPGYGAVIFRRTYPQIRNEGSLWDESSKLYPLVGGIPKESLLKWQFPTGSSIRFAHLQHEKNVYDYHSAQLVRIGFEELTQFEAHQFWYLLTRNRSTSGLKPQVRATCNPDADSWVASLVQWWIDPEGFPIPSRSGIIRWFVRVDAKLHWADEPQKLREQFPGIEPKSFTFIAAKITDNPKLLSVDPGYLANLQAQHPVDKARLLDGNWKVRFEAGKVFNRNWFEIVSSVPSGGVTIRFWDLAATAADVRASSYYTAGVLMTWYNGTFYVLDLVAAQVSPGETDQLILSTASSDGQQVRVRWELEGGSAGIRDAEHLKGLLSGFNALAVRPLGDKLTRAKPLASDASQGKVKLLRAPWNDRYLNALHDFDGSPKPLTNDITDASSGAYAELADATRPRQKPIGTVSYNYLSGKRH